jgi:hypothetical protein
MPLFKFFFVTIKLIIYIFVEEMNLVKHECIKRDQKSCKIFQSIFISFIIVKVLIWSFSTYNLIISVGNFILMQLTKSLMTNTSKIFVPLKVMITLAVFKLVEVLLRRLECNYLFGSSLSFKNRLDKFDQASP